jgi:nitroimidazol reductase NimA-like FMN-containing flavoprotein (pyridoxamine 5'-phosphate oxidase superfamily)
VKQRGPWCSRLQSGETCRIKTGRPSDKTLAVVEFLGADNVPIAVCMNYATHPIDFYWSGVVSGDCPKASFAAARLT